MEEIFKNIDIEKKDRIINSALEEFSKNSFNKASTNNIVKNAGISKGLLYHYFKSKKNLYEYLETFAIETVINTILDEIHWEESDLFSRIKHIILLKIKICVRYPYLVSFSKTMYEKRTIDEIKKLAETHTPNLYSEVYHRNIDFNIFKDNIDIEKAIKLTQWTMEKFGEEWLKNVEPLNGEVDYEVLAEEIDLYLKMLKDAFYK